MNLATLLERLPRKGIDGLRFPRNLLGTFRRKSISFCTGVTDETTVVYWLQSKSFSIDLRLPEEAATPLTERQGWVGDTLWDDESGLLSWQIARSYQPRNQWPEPARLNIVGNCVLEFAPSGAYVEDWRQKSSSGPFLGLRLVSMLNEATGQETPADGGFVIAGEHAAFAQSRLPRIDDALERTGSLESALAAGIATEEEIESYEVSVAIGGRAITYSTRNSRLGETIGAGDFSICPDGTVAHERLVGGELCVLIYEVDVFEPDFTFDTQTPSTSEVLEWMEQEKCHLARHAVLVN
ncbi:MAG: hypothetical protein P0Y56_13930 [Candidatus Andeanibacterium colombiense]|uniref:Uncharacterized protein n=1 Tax=Candidatus Andeanibacterium colombiense TaxID=3121345 RepID=A0AAJ6BP66_9SPHN|nr:MAG: hypothetical protein P0Y56_13930 [Sphingomonadaceae bacterium]